MPAPMEDQFPKANASASGSQPTAKMEEPRISDPKHLSSLLDMLAEDEDDDEQAGPAADVEENESDGDENGDGDEHGQAEAADGPGGETSAAKSKKKKKNKKKSKTSKALGKLKDVVAPGDAVPDQLVEAVKTQMQQQAPPGKQVKVDDEEIRKALKAMNLMKVLEGKEALGNKSNTKDIGEHKFWKTQPVPQTFSENLQRAAGGGQPLPETEEREDGPIDDPKTVDDVRKEPLALPKGYEWCTPDITKDDECNEVQVLLSENYVEDPDASFRLHYSKEFLHWALGPPGYVADWHIGIRQSSNKKLIAFISGIPIETRVRDHTIKTAEINFLVAHKNLRSKRLAPVLIKEVTRRVNLHNIWQAVYTAGVVLPTPVGVCRYYHRTLNAAKLVDIGFTPVRRGDTVSRMTRKYALPGNTAIPHFREMTKQDVPQVGALLREYMSRFKLEQKFESDEQVEHWFVSGQGTGENVPGQGKTGQVVWAYVVEDPSTNRITDFISFYSLPSLIMKHPKHKNLGTAYLYYYATDTAFPLSSGSASSEQTADMATRQRLSQRLNDLVKDTLIMAKQAGFDVFNALTLMDNNVFLKQQLFGAGDGFLNYYLYNWRTGPIDGAADGVDRERTSDIGLVML